MANNEANCSLTAVVIHFAEAAKPTKNHGEAKLFAKKGLRHLGATKNGALGFDDVR